MLRPCGSTGAVLECTVEFKAGNSMYSMIILRLFLKASGGKLYDCDLLWFICLHRLWIMNRYYSALTGVPVQMMNCSYQSCD